MAAVKLTFEVIDPEVLYAAGWTQIKIERSTDTGVSWTEISRATTRIPLRDVVEWYVYSDGSGDVTYLYRAVYYNPVTDVDEGFPLSITDIQVDAYATLAEIRSEGVTVADASDARVAVALEWSARYIERATRRRFGSRFGIQRFDVPTDSDTLLLPEPIIALLYMESGGLEVDLSTMDVYNRHLRGGEMCDLSSPKIKITDDLDADTYYRLWYGSVGFDRGSQSMSISGIWGYTELTSGVISGETVDGSQVPLDYGVIPPLINWACRALTLQHLFPMYTQDEIEARANQVLELKTRDQHVKFSDVAADASSGWAGSSAITEVLSGYCKSISFGAP